MKKQGYTEVILRLVRSALLIDAGFVTAVGLVGLRMGWPTPEAYGSALIRIGMLVILVGCLTAAGGFSLRVQDSTALSISNAGNPAERLRQISESRRSSFGCVLLLVMSGIGLSMIGWLFQIIPTLVGRWSAL